MAFATLSKRCANCYAAEKSKKKPALHDCRKNFAKSSKAMEGDAAADVGKQLQSDGVDLATMVDDDDSSAIKVLLEQCSSLIEKNSDINHVKKNLGNKLYDLKADGHSELSTKVIKYVQRASLTLSPKTRVMPMVSGQRSHQSSLTCMVTMLTVAVGVAMQLANPRISTLVCHTVKI